MKLPKILPALRPGPLRLPKILLALRPLTLRTQLLLTMLSLLLLSVSALFLLHLYSEAQLLSEVRDYTDELSTAIEIAQEQPEPMAGKDKQEVLRAFVERLRQLGVQDVSIANEEAVQASTNPAIVGKRIVTTKKTKGPKQVIIRGVLGGEGGASKTQRTSTLTLPVLVGDWREGYVVITRYLDDFSNLSKANLAGRIVATLVVFGLGMLVALYLSWSFSRPVQRLTDAAREVAAGNLQVMVPPEGGVEISSLTRTFNEMVARLREKRLLEERLHFAERSTALGRLASAVAHEIRNPLNFISLSIDHVGEKLGPESSEKRPDFERVLADMKSEIGRLNRLVGDFLSFGKPMRLRTRQCALGDVVRAVAALVDHKARDQAIDLSITIEPDLPAVMADAELLKTCLLNLMINAVDAMPHGGKLRVSASRGRDSSGEVLLIEVADNGRGMSAEEIAAAFEPYFSTKDTGLGLGLALTHKIVSDHGGSIALESAAAKGTTARIVLPAATQTERVQAVAS
jgi:nitrogen fixation/metabolism regulation signal transduction histidine kinase